MKGKTKNIFIDLETGPGEQPPLEVIEPAALDGRLKDPAKIEADKLKRELQDLTFYDIPSRWLNNEAMLLMTSFGKDITLDAEESVEINSIHNPVLFKYYLNGNWDLY